MEKRKLQCRGSQPLHRSLRWLVVGLLCLVAPLMTSPASAQTSSPGITGLELTPEVQRQLEQVPDLFLAWQGSFYQDEQQDADQFAAQLRQTVEDLEMRRLPDVQRAMLAAAQRAAREDGDFARAAWALDAAELMDPVQPETAFARATIDRLQGKYVGMLQHLVEGYVGLWRQPVARTLLLYNASLLAILVVVVSCMIFLLLLIARRGGDVLRGLATLFRRWMPPPAALALAVLLLGAPLFLPAGLLWLLMLWTMFLWGSITKSERLVLAFGWLLLSLSPWVLGQQERTLSGMLSPPMRVLDDLSNDRLSGHLFADLRALRNTLPSDLDVDHLVADLHRRFGQWEQARTLYQQLIREDSKVDDSSLWVNMGIYYFNQEDYGGAQERFLRATSLDAGSAQAFFNLSQAYGANYEFDESSRALAEAQRLAPAAVGRWVERQDRRVHPLDGGFRRIPELRQRLALAQQEGGQTEVTSTLRRVVRQSLSVFAVLGMLLGAYALQMVAGTAQAPPSKSSAKTASSRKGRPAAAADEAGSALGRVLVPGWKSLGTGSGFAAFAALAPVVFLLLLPFSAAWGYRMPIEFSPGGLLLQLIMALGLLVVLLVRLLLERSE